MTEANQKKWLNVGKMFLAGIIFYLLVKTSQLNLHLLGALVDNATLFFSFVAIIFMVVFITAWRWHLLSDAQQVSLGLKKTLKPAYIGGAFNTLLPGSVGGDFIRCHYVFKRIPERKSAILLTVFFDRVIGLMGILTTLCLAALLQIVFIAEQPKLFYLLLLLLCACGGLFIAILTLMVLPQRLGVSARLKRNYAHSKWALRIAGYFDVFHQYRIPKMVIFKAVIISTIVEYLLVASLLIIAKMMGLPALNFSQVVLALGMTLLVSVIPVTPGGIGVGEMAFANILLLLNPGSTIAYATIYLGYRLLSMLAYLPALWFYLPKINLLQKKI
ncbi:MAG: lysylphosphatidylglycerol synthase transmembrane domain-containing protein [Pseudomonadota bacterium]